MTTDTLLPTRFVTTPSGPIAYVDTGGSGRPILLIHGFASNKAINWIYPGWVDTLTKAGFRVVALDNRGHGESMKLYDPADYRIAAMAGDAVALLDHLALPTVDLMGYSMGARISTRVTLDQPKRVRTLILGGMATGLFSPTAGPPEPIVAALEAPSLRDVPDRTGRSFRAFAEQTKSDLKALAACIKASREVFSRDEIARVAAPTLIGVGTRDTIAGSPEELAALMPDAVSLPIPGRDHMVAVGDKVFKEGALAFLAAHA
ncbi:alpha/beta fold hydrolase [Segnochrobactraceae bacterium EtOH-i3]